MLPKANRLTEKSDFENVRQNGKHVSTPVFTAAYVRREILSPRSDRDSRMTAVVADGLTHGSAPTISRFGFIVSKKISMKANVRNRVKRIFREFFRKNIASVKEGMDIVIVAKPGIIHADHATIESTLRTFLEESTAKNKKEK